MRLSKQFTVFAFLFFLALVLIFLHIRGKSAAAESAAVQAPRPFIYVLQGAGHALGSFFSYFSQVSSLNQLNARLEQQNRSLQQNNVALQQYKLENDKLKSELNYRQTAPFGLVSATVISKDPTGFSQAVIINAGSRDGIQSKAAVLAQGVLIGKVTEVNDFTSKVLLVTDPQSTLDAQISATGDNALVRGSYGSGMVIDMVSQNIQINKDDQVVTAGLNQDIPRGILIGTIGDLQSAKNDLLQKATVISSADLKNLNFVSVIKK